MKDRLIGMFHNPYNDIIVIKLILKENGSVSYFKGIELFDWSECDFKHTKYKGVLYDVGKKEFVDIYGNDFTIDNSKYTKMSLSKEELDFFESEMIKHNKTVTYA